MVKITTLTRDNIAALAMMGDPNITLGKTVATFALPAAEALDLIVTERNRRRASMAGKHRDTTPETYRDFYGAASYRSLDAVIRKLRKAAA